MKRTESGIFLPAPGEKVHRYHAHKCGSILSGLYKIEGGTAAYKNSDRPKRLCRRTTRKAETERRGIHKMVNARAAA